MKQPETPLTREQIEAWRNLGAAYVEHMPDGEAMFTALCDAALRGLARQEGQEPRGCPTPGACSCPQTPAMEEAPSEIERLRAGLQWYADGHHYDLPDWEDCSGESPNWIFPNSDQVIGEPSWMVDNGGIARAVLNGDYVNPNHADADSIIIGKVETAGDHAAAMSRIETLMPDDPAPDTPAGKELLLLATLVEAYEDSQSRNISRPEEK